MKLRVLKKKLKQNCNYYETEHTSLVIEQKQTIPVKIKKIKSDGRIKEVTNILFMVLTIVSSVNAKSGNYIATKNLKNI